jgi:hypothetical protein
MSRFPHWSMPFRFDYLRSGEAFIPTNEQDTSDEIADAVWLTLQTEQGQRSTLPPFGRPRHLAFLVDGEMMRAGIQAAVDENEPRAAAIIQRTPLDPDDHGRQRLLALLEIAHLEEGSA